MIVATISKPPELKLGQGLLYGGLRTLHYDLVDMHKKNLNIQEGIGFQRWLIIKLIMDR
jgi:hypothetical protein